MKRGRKTRDGFHQTNFILMKRIFRFFSLFFLLLCSQSQFAQNIYPGAYGFGTQSGGAYAGDSIPAVLFVTSLDDNGEGSLRYALSCDYPRIIIFNVSGTIRLAGALFIKEPCVFIAGQSAPGKGISVTGAPVIVNTHDVLIQDIRFRLGSAYPRKSDCVSITGTLHDVYNVVFDHCSFGFGLDENIGILNSGPGITISNSIIGYGLHKFEHSCGLLAMNSEKISLIGNIFAFNHDRNPNIRGDTKDVEILNNLIYNSASHAIYLGSRGPDNSPVNVLIEGNIYVTGADNMNRYLLSVHQDVADSLNVSWHKNLTFHETKVFKGIREQVFDQSGRFNPVDPGPFPASDKELIALDKLEQILLHNSGARAHNRDGVDSLLIANIMNRSGKIISVESELNIQSELPVMNEGFVLPDDPHHTRADGFTNLQHYLQELLLVKSQP
ncbi:MAG: hypothetical protein PWQ17_358 [Anaerophaga sp.]|nr:hypothetical protein [Anaerophaga sp.]MDK2840853.1 hypothetical protein [Anaerophaga sp.]MDN5291196.1 hypothetical protein [Anaerophaga sp.]